MADPAATPQASADPPATPETVALLLTVFADLYRQEVGAKEDVHRTWHRSGALGLCCGRLRIQHAPFSRIAPVRGRRRH